MSDSEKSVNSPRTYTCRKCNKTFPTPQALGGHQRAHKQPNNAGATSSPLTPPAAAATTNTTIIRRSSHNPSYPSYSSITTSSTWGGSSGTGLTFYLLPSSSNSSGPSPHELPLFPPALKTIAEGDAKMTTQDPDTTLRL